MTDPVERINLLEGPARKREIAIQDADAAITDLDTDLVRRVGGPNIADVPIGNLPARAWARSVDVYDPAWPEEVRRAVIVAAPQVQSLKGSLGAVETALAALRVDAVITEWFQETPRGAAYTFTVRAYARARLYDGPLLDARLVKVVFSSVLRAKPLSRAFDLIVGANLPATGNLAPVLVGKLVCARAVIPRPRATVAAAMGLAPVIVGKVRVARSLVPALPPVSPA